MRFAVLVAVGLCGCATVPVRDEAALDVAPPPPPPPPPEAPRVNDAGARIARHADALVGIASLKTVTHLPDDCTGLVRYAYGLEGIELMPARGTRGTNGVTAIWVAARAKNALHAREPRAGDLVFFRETYDRDRDGRLDDGLTHIGVVDSVLADGTVHFIHRSGRGVTRERLNPYRPRDRSVNDWLRVRSHRAPAALTGELFVGYASWPELLAGPSL